MIHHALDLKVAIAGGVALIAAVGDVNVDPRGWEDVSLKVLLILALIFIGRLYLAQMREHKAEMKEAWAMHKKESNEREERHNRHLAANTECLTALVVGSREQTDFFRTVTRGLVEERIKKPTLP